jgi:hypothetical protein
MLYLTPVKQQLMDAHHYLGHLPEISETLWHIALFAGQWVALWSFSAAAWKCSARDRWNAQIDGCHSRMLLAGIQVSCQIFPDSLLRGNDR